MRQIYMPHGAAPERPDDPVFLEGRRRVPSRQAYPTRSSSSSHVALSLSEYGITGCSCWSPHEPLGPLGELGETIDHGAPGDAEDTRYLHLVDAFDQVEPGDI